MPNRNRDKKNQTNKEYYHRNKERILKVSKERYGKEYYDLNRERILETSKISRTNNYEVHLYRGVKNRCNRTQIEFNLDIEDIVIPDICPYLKVPLTRVQGQGRVWSNASVDRIDPAKGYTKDNIQIISNKANLMKNNATEEELIQFAKSILDLSKPK